MSLFPPCGTHHRSSQSLAGISMLKDNPPYAIGAIIEMPLLINFRSLFALKPLTSRNHKSHRIASFMCQKWFIGSHCAKWGWAGFKKREWTHATKIDRILQKVWNRSQKHQTKSPRKLARPGAKYPNVRQLPDYIDQAPSGACCLQMASPRGFEPLSPAWKAGIFILPFRTYIF